MNNTYKKAIAVLGLWEEEKSEMRNYDNQYYHCVDVKRYKNDKDNFDLKTSKRVLQLSQADYNLLENYFTDSEINNWWYNWLESERDMFIDDISGKNCEITDIPFFTDRGINNLEDLSSFHFNGRSGGWFCFQSNAESVADEIEHLTNNYFNQDGEFVNSDYSPRDKEDVIKDLEMEIEGLTEVLKQIDVLKEYTIYLSNLIDFQDYMDGYPVEMILGDIKEAKMEKQKEVIKELTISDNEKIKRLAKGILKELEQ